MIGCSTSEEEKEAMHLQNVIDVIQGEGLMPAVKVVCDWMKCNSNVIMTCAQVGIKLVTQCDRCDSGLGKATVKKD